MKVLGGIYRVLEGGVGFKGFGGENEKKKFDFVAKR